MSRQSSQPAKSLRDRTMVVSGASRGIGLAIAVGAATRGANVVPECRYGGGDDPIIDIFVDTP